MTTAPTFFVLHDVTANTYSRELIVNSKLKNLHDLFKVRPRWFNRSRTICDNVMLIRFKNATPRTKYQMVPLSETNRKVRHALKCLLHGGQLFGGGKKAKVAAAIAVGGVGLLAFSSAHYLTVKENNKLNKECLESLKKTLGAQNTGTFKIRQDCSGIFKNVELLKDKKIGQGAYGTIWSVQNNPSVVIKEQKAFCYTFINEINCLNALKDTDIVPKLYDAYICFKANVADVTNSEITYGYVMENCGISLKEFIKQATEQEINDLGQELCRIVTKLDENQIQHRDLKLENFLVKKNNEKISIVVIDFGHAKYDKKSEMVYNVPFPVEEMSNVKTFNGCQTNTTLKEEKVMVRFRYACNNQLQYSKIPNFENQNFKRYDSSE